MAKPPQARRPLGSGVPILGPLISRPRLASAIVFGVVVALALTFIPNHLRPSTRVVFSWDAVLGWFIMATLVLMCECDESKIRARAASQDEGQHFILGLAIVAAAASVVAIGIELSLAKADHGLVKTLRVLLAFLTVAGSWLFVQIVFALHYAHEYYAEDRSSVPRQTGKARKHRGGLAFPDDDTPDYWDFLHFAAIIGVAAQTADIAFTSKTMRRTGTVHGMVAFVFNTVVLALTINLLAGLF